MLRSALITTLVLVAAPTGSFPIDRPDAAAAEPDSLAQCDSATTAMLIQQVLIGNGHHPKSQRVDMLMPGHAAPVTLYMGRHDLWHEPVFRFKKSCWNPAGDSVTIAVHRVVDIDNYLQRAAGDDDVVRAHNGTHADLVWSQSPDSFRAEEIRLDTVTFPPGVNKYWHRGAEVLDVGLIQLGDAKAPLFSASMEAFAPHDCDTHTRWVNEGLWYRHGDRYKPMGFLQRSFAYSEFEGVDRLDMETVHRVEDVDGDGDAELVYARRYIAADEGVQVEFSDVGEIVMEFQEGDPPSPPTSVLGNVSGIPPELGGRGYWPRRRPATIQPVRIVLPDGRGFPARPHMPVLLFPGARASGRAESVIRSGNMSSSIGPPTGGGNIMRMGLDHLGAFQQSRWWDDHRPTLSVRLTDDSLEFEADIYQSSYKHPEGTSCSDADYTVVLWFDTDLTGDFDSSACSDDERAYLIQGDPADSSAAVRICDIHADPEHVSVVERNRYGGWFRPSRQMKSSPQRLRWRVARHEVGLGDREGTPVMCGFAAEVTCAGIVSSGYWRRRRPGLSYPPTFDRGDPGTWCMLMIADRKDTVYSATK